jgi:hypothetical protein
VVGAVALLHGLLLQGLPQGPGPGWQAAATRPLQVRQIVRPSEIRQAGLQAAPLSPSLSRPPAAAAEPAREAAAASPSPAEPAPPKTPATQPAATPDPVEAAGAATPPPGGTPVPVYRTRLPPPQTLHYELRRGRALGSAELSWAPSPSGQYQLSLKGDLPGAATLGWGSRGGLDADGIAPLRYVEMRRGREAHAANFQRDSGRISFSGPSVEHPLAAGAQDRLSWMVQLAGVLAAEPTLAEVGAQVSMWVVGSRGDGEVWTFVVLGLPDLDLPIGRVEGTVHLIREPRRPYDTQVQVWLDPQRHHLPVQVQWRVRAGGEGQDLRLQGLK